MRLILAWPDLAQWGAAMFVTMDSVRRSVRAGLCGVTWYVLASSPVFAETQPAQPDSAVPVTVTRAMKQDVPVWLRGLGTVQAYYAVQLRPRVDGTLTQVPVKEGQDVKQGDLLAMIDPRPYQAVLDAAIAKKQQDQAQLANAEADFSRYASLVQRKFASRQQFDTQQALVKQLSAALLGDDAQIEAARLNLSFCFITAPFDGRIGLRNVDPGNVVHSAEATPIVSVTQIQPISVTFTLPQDDLPAIMQAMEKRALDVVVYGSDNATELDRGVLLTPDNTIDATTGTIKLKATFTNVHRTLWPGQFVNVRLLLGTQGDVVAVAATSVQHGPDGLFVYQVGPNNTISVQPIKVERQEGDIYVVSTGLSAGALVVATGQSRLQAGTRVSVRPESQAVPVVAIKSGS
jgi:multidrug efflux system membrane fusion protein